MVPDPSCLFLKAISQTHGARTYRGKTFPVYSARLVEQFDDIASTMAGSIVMQVLVPFAEERGAGPGFKSYLGIYEVSEDNVLEHFDAACSMLAIMSVKAEGQDPAGPSDPRLIKVEDEIDARMKNLLDLALPEWAAGVRQEYGP